MCFFIIVRLNILGTTIPIYQDTSICFTVNEKLKPVLYANFSSYDTHGLNIITYTYFETSSLQLCETSNS